MESSDNASIYLDSMHRYYIAGTSCQLYRLFILIELVHARLKKGSAKHFKSYINNTSI